MRPRNSDSDAVIVIIDIFRKHELDIEVSKYNQERAG